MRIEALGWDRMDAAQRGVHDEAVGGRRGQAPVPLTAWIRSPELARHAQRLGEAIRFELALPARAVALAALVIASHWRAPYVWAAQSAKLRAAGFSEQALDAIRNGETPALEDETDRIVCLVVRTLLDRQELDDTLYAAAVAVLGEPGLVELVAAAGYYTMVAMTLKTFEIEAAPAAGEGAATNGDRS